MEWEPNRRSILVHQNDKPKPLRMGCLILSNREGNKGTAIYAWEHKTGLDTICDEITLDPFGIIFDFSGESVNEPVMAQYARHVGVPVTREVWEKKYQIDRDQLLANSKWSKLSKVAAEIDAYIELEKASGIVPLYHCAEMFQSEIGGKLLRPGQQMYENFMEDLQGEFAYTQAFLLMLNTKNSVIAQKREDLSRFNKSRIKRRKLPVKEFIVTNLHPRRQQVLQGIGAVGNRASARGMSREAARLHLVRGHFKTKPSGVYWWSSHVRGGNEDEIAVRKNYKVSV